MYRSRSELTSIPCPTSNCGVRASASPGETMRAKTTAQTTAIKRGFDGFPAARENSTSVGTWAISRIIPTGYRLDLLRTTHHAVVQRLPRNRDLFCVSRRPCSSWQASVGPTCYPLWGRRANPWTSGHSWGWTATRRPSFGSPSCVTKPTRDCGFSGRLRTFCSPPRALKISRSKR